MSLVVGALLGAGRVKADNEKTLGPEVVSRRFFVLLTALNNRRYHNDIFLAHDKDVPVANSSFRDLGDMLGLTLVNMGRQLEEPHFKATVTSSDEFKALVRVERDEKSFPHDVTLISEDGAWRVDVLATYATWNKISTQQALQRLKGAVRANAF